LRPAIRCAAALRTSAVALILSLSALAGCASLARPATDHPVLDIYRATIPFFLILLATVLIIIYWPALSLVLISGGD
jgi:TRAP-type mannitol/chloroaromatic compound transport system permease large subunit